MRHYIRFDLPEDAEDLTLATKALDLYLSLLDMDLWLRDQIKYHGREELQPVRDKLFEIMDDRDVRLDMVS